MKILNLTSRTVIATLLAGGAMLTASAAFAQQDRMYGHDGPPPAYGQPHLVPVGVSINVGWHGDRYYDGHRYWQHDEWMHHHPHDPGPPRHREHDDHRPPARY
jgi:hypothetical protein